MALCRRSRSVRGSFLARTGVAAELVVDRFKIRGSSGDQALRHGLSGGRLVTDLLQFGLIRRGERLRLQLSLRLLARLKIPGCGGRRGCDRYSSCSGRCAGSGRWSGRRRRSR